MLRDWLADWVDCCSFSSVVYFPSYFDLSQSQSLLALPAVGSVVALACCWLCSSRFFSSFLPFSTLSAALRAHSTLRCSSRCPCARVASLSSFHHWLVGCGSVSDSHHVAPWLWLSLSDPLHRHFVVGYIFLDVSPALPTPLLSIALFVIVGSR